LTVRHPIAELEVRRRIGCEVSNDRIGIGPDHRADGKSLKNVVLFIAGVVELIKVGIMSGVVGKWMWMENREK